MKKKKSKLSKLLAKIGKQPIRLDRPWGNKDWRDVIAEAKFLSKTK